MRRELLLIIGLCLVATGCKNADPHCRRETALLRAEILDLEDKYYMLKSERDQALSELQVYQGVTSSGEIIYESDMTGSSGSGVPLQINNGSGTYAPNEVVPPSTQSPLNGTSDDPIQIDLSNPETIFPGDSSTPELLPAPNGAFRDGSGLRLNSPETNSPQRPLAGIVIDRKQSRGHDVDGRPGHEGLNLMIQPKTSNGQTALVPGKLTVSVIDPAAKSSAQRIGLWKFLPDETELFFANENLRSRGILLHLPWDQATPRNDQLLVFVRFETADGNRLETSSEIRIEPPAASYSADDPLVAGWTQRDQRWQSSAGSSGRRTIKAIPASSGSARIKKPSWRPVR